MSDTAETPVSPEAIEVEARRTLYRAMRVDPERGLAEIVTEAMGTLRSLAAFNHGDLAQDRAREAVERIDRAVSAILEDRAAILEAGNAG